MAFKITIPEPCHENWHAMTPTQKGAFCDKCEKEVIDFTAYSNYELARKLGRGENLCGRFRASQLNTPLPTLERSRWRERMAALGFTALAGFGNSVLAQVKAQKVKACHAVDTLEIIDYITPTEILATGEVAFPEDSVSITGTIVDSEGNGLPGANVVVLGTHLAAQADFDGHFTLEVPDVYLQKPFTIYFNYLGYEYQEAIITSDKLHLEITLNEDTTVLGEEVIIIGRPNIFRRIGNLFRRKY